jgi:hypothetical protein
VTVWDIGTYEIIRGSYQDRAFHFLSARSKDASVLTHRSEVGLSFRSRAGL